MNAKETRSSATPILAASRSSRRRSSPAPGCPRSRAPPGVPSDASVALIDRSSNVLAVAAASPDEERKLLAGGAGVETVELRVADTSVGELRWRPRGEDEPDAALLRMVTTLLGLELERSRSPEWATEEAAGDFVRALLDRKITDRGDIEARAAELGTDLAERRRCPDRPRACRTSRRRASGARASWRSRCGRSGRSVPERSPPRANPEGEGAEVVAIVPADDEERLDARGGRARQ